MKAMKFWLLIAVMMVAIAAHARKNDDPEIQMAKKPRSTMLRK